MNESKVRNLTPPLPNFKMGTRVAETLTIAYLNIQGQTGLNVVKQKQIEYFMKQNDVDILNCQEINIDGESFNNCPFISSKYNILQNNAVNKFGTAVIVKSDYNVENVKTDTMGRAIFYEINKMTFGNIYLQSGTDGISRGLRENFISETLPQLLVNCRDSGEIGGDLNYMTKGRRLYK